MSNIKQSVSILDQAITIASVKGVFTTEEKAIIFSQLLEISKYIENKEEVNEPLIEDVKSTKGKK